MVEPWGIVTFEKGFGKGENCAGDSEGKDSTRGAKE